MDTNKKNINITEITYGECPPELHIVMDETIQSVDLHKIILSDLSWPNVVTGLKIMAVQTS